MHLMFCISYSIIIVPINNTCLSCCFYINNILNLALILCTSTFSLGVITGYVNYVEHWPWIILSSMTVLVQVIITVSISYYTTEKRYKLF